MLFLGWYRRVSRWICRVCSCIKRPKLSPGEPCTMTIDALLAAFHERLTRLEAQANPTPRGSRTDPLCIKCAHQGELSPTPLWSFTSYNILALETGGDGYYRNLDGTPKSMDVGERRQAINQKVVGWMGQGRIICLQEVTAGYLSKESNPELHDALRAQSYDVYHHHYQWSVRKDLPAKGLFLLGLAILVPSRLYSVRQAALLWPWKDPVIPPSEQAELDGLEKRCSEATSIRKALAGAMSSPKISPALIQRAIACAAVGAPDPASVDAPGPPSVGDLMEQLQERADSATSMMVAIRARFPNTTDEPFKDRTAIALVLEDSARRRMVVTNIHLPCKYQDPTMMASVAFRVKQGLLDWMAASHLTGLPMLLCGDFNSGPLGNASTAYDCLVGSLGHSSSWVDRRITKADFDKYVTREPWHDALAESGDDGCTTFGFTKPRFDAAKAEFQHSLADQFACCRAASDSCSELETYVDMVLKCETQAECEAMCADAVPPPLDLLKAALSTKRDFFKPTPLWLDHFFIRFAGPPLRVVSHTITKESQVVKALHGKPIPNLAIGEASDHLPVHLSLGWGAS